MIPGLRRITVMRGRGEGAQAFESIATAVIAYAIEAQFVELGSADDISPAFAAMQASRSQAVIVVDGPLLNNLDARIAGLAATYRLPRFRRFADTSTPAHWRRMAPM